MNESGAITINGAAVEADDADDAVAAAVDDGEADSAFSDEVEDMKGVSSEVFGIMTGNSGVFCGEALYKTAQKTAYQKLFARIAGFTAQRITLVLQGCGSGDDNPPRTLARI